jgi:hypothetical protein
MEIVRGARIGDAHVQDLDGGPRSAKPAFQQGEIVVLVGDHSEGERVSEGHDSESLSLLGRKLEVVKTVGVEAKVIEKGVWSVPKPLVRVVKKNRTGSNVINHPEHDLSERK